MPRLSLKLFGSFQVALDGQPLTGFESDKTRALLAYLATEAGRPHRREALAGLLWPNVLESSARRSLSQALFNLRQTLRDAETEPSCFSVTRDTIQFNTEADFELDVRSFGERLKQGELEEAVALYRGDFLHGFFIEDSSAFEEWALVQREELRRLALNALGQLAQQQERAGAYEAAVGYASRQLELDPWREDAHRQKMRALALSGARGAALAQYEACRKALLNELGVEPSAETRALWEQIQKDEIRQAEVAPQAQPTAFRLQLAPLPQLLSPFIGRERELAEIARLLAEPDCRLLTLAGPGGMGKTRLALESAARQRAAFADGVAFIALQPLTAPEAILPAIAAGLGLGQFDPSALSTALAAALRDRQMLLVLDNFEHLLEGVPRVSELLGAAPGLKVLATSREALNVEGEWVLELSSFALAEAGALFVQRARQARATFTSSEAESGAIRRVCELVGGLPLAIVLAASWVSTLTVSEIVQELERGLGGLASARRDMPERHRSLRAVFDQSWQLLTPEEQGALARLAVFRGGFTREAANQVAGASLAVLAALVSKSLVRRFAAGRYDLHELVRQYAALRLYAQTEAYAATRTQHLHYCLDLAERTYFAFNTPHFAEWVEKACDDYENLETALAWAIETDAERALRLARSLINVWPRRRIANAVPWLERALQAAERSPTPVSASAKAAALCVLSFYLVTDLERSEALAQESLELARAAADPVGIALAWNALGTAQLAQGRAVEAIPVLEESLRQLQALNLKGVMALTLDKLGTAERYLSRYAPALQHHAASLALARELNRVDLIANALASHAHIDFRLGNFDRARQYLAESRPLWESVRHRSGTFWVDLLAIRCDILQGRLAQAEAQLRRANQADETTRDFWYDEDQFNEVYGYYAYFSGDFATARQRYAAAYQASLTSGNLRGRLWTLFGLGLVARASGNLSLASELIRDAQQIARTINEQWFVAWADLAMGQVHLSLGQPEAAVENFRAGVTVAAQYGARHILAMHLNGLAQAAARTQQAERALCLFGLSAALREQMAIPIPPVERAEHETALAGARASMNEASAAAAWEQGRALAINLESAVVFALDGAIP